MKSKRYEIIKNYGQGGASESDSLAKAKTIAKAYSERTGEPSYIADWANGGAIVFEAI